MEHERWLEITKIKLQNKDRYKDLFSLTAERIVKNFEFFAGQQRKHNSDELIVLSTMPGSVRQKLIPKLTDLVCEDKDGDEERFGRILKVFGQLLSPATTQVALNGLMTFCPKLLKMERLKEVVQMIATHAPNIRSLAVSLKPLIHNLHYVGWNLKMDEETVQALGKLRNLRKLVIQGSYLNTQDLIDTGKKLTNLVHLEVRLNYDRNVFEDSYMEEFKRSFLNLRHVNCVRNNGKCIQFPLQDFPQLELINMVEDTNPFWNMETCAPPDIEMDLPSNLRRLCVDRPQNTRPWHLMFPNVTNLRITYMDRVDMGSLLQFKKIRYLSLYGLQSSGQIDLFLKKYGRNLRLLTLNSEFELDYEMKKIINLCPKLEALQVSGLIFTDDAKPLGIATNLKIFKRFYLYAKDAKNLCFRNILSAMPRLEHLDLIGFNLKLDPSDLNKISTMIAKKSILTELRTFKFVIRKPYRDDRLSASWSEALILVFLTALSVCSNLTQIRTYLNVEEFLDPVSYDWYNVLKGNSYII